MNKDILSRWDDIKTRLNETMKELEEDYDNGDINDDVAEDLDLTVIDHLRNSIEGLEEIINSAEKMQEAETFYDPYEEGLE